MGTRMGSLTQDKPKCMLDVGGRPLLHNTIDVLRGAGCDKIVVIVGYNADVIDAPGCELIVNDDFQNNNILHSLMCAREFLNDEVVCCYSDIWVEPEVAGQLVAVKSDIAVVTDMDWRNYYINRSDHPISEAENVFVTDESQIRKIGKYLDPGNAGADRCGEFIGMWYMSAMGCKLFRDVFDEIDLAISMTDPFQHAEAWQKSYITDLVQEIVDRGHQVHAVQIRMGWAELDTVQDIERVEHIAEAQRLYTLHERVMSEGAM